MVSPDKVALDGTKVWANASRQKVMSYARLTGKQKVLAEEISALMEEPIPTAHRNFTGPDVRIMKTADGSYHYTHTGQAVVDYDRQVIVATELNNVAVDVQQLKPMIEHTVATVGAMPAI